jgi:hypothetical protein
VGKIIEEVGKKTEVIDIVCKAANIIKALACAAAQLPTGTTTITGGGGGGGGGGSLGGGQGFGGGWNVVGSGCFVAGTPITLADGTTQLIENIRSGDRLQSNATGRVDAVAQVMTLTSDHVRQLKFRPRGVTDARETELRLTHDHRVWVDGRGWVFSIDVKVGDWLHGSDGQFYEVTSNEQVPGRHEVYGVHMDRDNVFYAAGILAEDQCFKPMPTFRANPTEVAR